MTRPLCPGLDSPSGDLSLPSSTEIGAQLGAQNAPSHGFGDGLGNRRNHELTHQEDCRARTPSLAFEANL
jgi:hypothetical protein